MDWRLKGGERIQELSVSHRQGISGDRQSHVYKRQEPAWTIHHYRWGAEPPPPGRKNPGHETGWRQQGRFYRWSWSDRYALSRCGKQWTVLSDREADQWRGFLLPEPGKERTKQPCRSDGRFVVSFKRFTRLRRALRPGIVHAGSGGFLPDLFQ